MMNLSRMAEITGLSLEECRGYRIDYLEKHLVDLADEIAAWEADPGLFALYFRNTAIDQAIDEARELRHLSSISKQNFKPTTGDITPDMIEQARQYPIEDLIQFDRQHKAVAFCHEDNHPSLSWHRAKNRATCFPCGKSFNPIDVLIQRDGITFPDAVKRLVA